MCYICVGILFLCVIASSISNNDSTSIANASNTQTQEAQQQVNKINVTTTDNNTYWYFTGQTSPTYKDNYYYALYVNNSTYYLSDMNSRNGTIVNGRLLLPEEEYRLQEEDEVDFAQARYIFLK